MMLKRTSFALALAAFILAAAAALRYAQGLEIISADAARRTMQVMIGLILAAYANVMPKDIGRWRASARAAATSQSALRVGGWSLTVAGLGYAGLWAFTPIAFADVAATVVVAAATLLTAAYGAWAFFTCRRTESSPALERHL
jgi:Ca2+/Na+ antiporter